VLAVVDVLPICAQLHGLEGRLEPEGRQLLGKGIAAHEEDRPRVHRGDLELHELALIVVPEAVRLLRPPGLRQVLLGFGRVVGVILQGAEELLAQVAVAERGHHAGNQIVGRERAGLGDGQHGLAVHGQDDRLADQHVVHGIATLVKVDSRLAPRARPHDEHVRLRLLELLEHIGWHAVLLAVVHTGDGPGDIGLLADVAHDDELVKVHVVDIPEGGALGEQHFGGGHAAHVVRARSDNLSDGRLEGVEVFANGRARCSGGFVQRAARSELLDQGWRLIGPLAVNVVRAVDQRVEGHLLEDGARLAPSEDDREVIRGLHLDQIAPHGGVVDKVQMEG